MESATGQPQDAVCQSSYKSDGGISGFFVTGDAEEGWHLAESRWPCLCAGSLPQPAR